MNDQGDSHHDVIRGPRLLYASTGLMPAMDHVDIEHLSRTLLSDQESDRTRSLAANQLARVASRCISVLQLGSNSPVELVSSRTLSALAGLNIATRATETGAPHAVLPRGYSLLLAHGRNLPLQLPEGNAYLESKDGRAARISGADQAESNSAFQAVVATGLPLPLVPEMAVKIECSEASWFYLPTVQCISKYAAREALTRNMIAGAVVQLRRTPEEQWSVPFFTLTQPANDGGKLTILLISSGGKLALAGELDTNQPVSPFILRTIKQPGAFAIEVKGTFERGQVRLESVRSDSSRPYTLVAAPKVRSTYEV